MTAESPTLPPAPPHRAFSLGRIRAIASNTLLELVRLKVFYFLLLFGLALIGSSLLTVNLSFQDQFQTLKDSTLGAMSIFTVLLSVLATAMIVPKDTEDRTLYTILAKPVPRIEYLLGKYAGVLTMLAVAVGVMSLLMVGVLYSRQQIVLAEKAAEYNPQAPALGDTTQAERAADYATEVAHIRASTFNWSLFAAVISIYLQAAVCASLTLYLSSFATSSIFTIMMAFTAYIVGYLQALAREVWLEQQAGTIFTKAFLALVALLFPDMHLFSLVNDIAAGAVVPAMLFWKMVGLGGTYIIIYLLAGYFMFAVREL